jgi:hypothetical protein
VRSVFLEAVQGLDGSLKAIGDAFQCFLLVAAFTAYTFAQATLRNCQVPDNAEGHNSIILCFSGDRLAVICRPATENFVRTIFSLCLARPNVLQCSC